MSKVSFWLREAVVPSVLSICLMCTPRASGSGVVYQFDNSFSGTSPNGAPPWVTATLQDVSPGTVLLNVSNVNVTGSEKITELYLNINPNYNVNNLQFSFVSGSAGVTAPLPSLGEDSFKADGDGKYDILFQFAQTPGSAFTANDFVTYKITGIPTLTGSDFVYLSTPAGGHGPFYSAIHVQGIAATSVGDTSNYSGWVSPSQAIILAVPEPGAGMLLLGAAGAGLVARRVRRRTTTT